MSALVATLVTIGLLTKNSELIVMRACGISLYRSALPLLLFAALVQRRAVRAAGAGAGRLEPRGGAPERDHPRLPDADVRRPQPPVDRRQRAATSTTTSSSIRAANQFNRLSMFHLDERAWKLADADLRREAALVKRAGADGNRC